MLFGVERKLAMRACLLSGMQEGDSVSIQPIPENDIMTPREKECLGRIARGEEVEADMASRLAGHGLIWRTGWGKLALSRAGVAALHDIRNAGNNA